MNAWKRYQKNGWRWSKILLTFILWLTFPIWLPAIVIPSIPLMFLWVIGDCIWKTLNGENVRPEWWDD